MKEEPKRVWCARCMGFRKVVEERQTIYVLECDHEVYNGK